MLLEKQKNFNNNEKQIIPEYCYSLGKVSGFIKSANQLYCYSQGCHRYEPKNKDNRKT